MYLSRIVLAKGQRLCHVTARVLRKVSAIRDVVCFSIQAAADGLLSGAKTTSKVRLGEAVIQLGSYYRS